MEGDAFGEAAEVVRSMVPGALGEVRVVVRRYGMKVWFGADAPPPLHYEAQVVGPKYVEGATALAIEVGFHLEDRRMERNDAILQTLLAAQPAWRRVLGDAPVAGPFLGRPDDWRRLSETWPDPDLGDPAIGFDLGTRLVDYVTALEPVLRA